MPLFQKKSPAATYLFSRDGIGLFPEARHIKGRRVAKRCPALNVAIACIRGCGLDAEEHDLAQRRNRGGCPHGSLESGHIADHMIGRHDNENGRRIILRGFESGHRNPQAPYCGRWVQA